MKWMRSIGKQWIIHRNPLLLAILFFIHPALYSQDCQRQPGVPLRIVQMSDTQPLPDDENQWTAVQNAVNLVNFLHPDLALMPGDITYAGTEPECIRMRTLLDQIQAPLHLVPGNHDLIYPANDAEKTIPASELHKQRILIYQKVFGPEQWTLEWGEFLFVGLDSTAGFPEIPEQNVQWLKEAFSKSDKPYKFLVTHYNPHPAKAHETLDPLLSSLGVVGFLHGHNHKIQAYEHPQSNRLIFSSGTAREGVMYFDVYDHYIVCFWKPLKGTAIPLGIFDLKKTAQKIAPPPIEQQDTTPPSNPPAISSHPFGVQPSGGLFLPLSAVSAFIQCVLLCSTAGIRFFNP